MRKMYIGLAGICIVLLVAASGKATDVHAVFDVRFYRTADYRENTSFVSRGIGIRLNTQNIMDTGFNFYLRFRGGKKPNYYSVSPSKLYDLHLSHDHLAGNFGFAAGRLNTPVVGAYGILDGIQLHYNLSGHWRMGGFAGAEPDLLTFEMKDDIKRFGLFSSFDLGNRYQGNYSVIYQSYFNRPDRVFFFMDNEIEIDEAWSFGQFAEIDLIEKNADDVRRETFRFTDFYADLRFRPSHRFSTTLTYTTHREFKYLESMSDIPDSLFENSVDQSFGLRISLIPLGSWRFYSRLRYGLNSAKNGNEHFVALGVANHRFIFDRTFLTARFAQNNGFYAQSNSWTVALEKLFWERIRASLAFSKSGIDYKISGSYIENRALDLAFTVNVSRALFLYVKGTRIKGDDRDETRVFLQVSYRFRHYAKKPLP